MEIKDKMYTMLSDYKKNVLGVNRNGKWSKNRKEYPHILPIEFSLLNLISGPYYSAEVGIVKTIKIHDGFHHLNSSQALTINLLVPLIIEDICEETLPNIEKNEKIIKSIFEYIPNRKEGTNFDFYLELNNSSHYFEVKYSEDNFGSIDKKKIKFYEDRFEKIYKSKLSTIASIDKTTFLNEYQLWRNIFYSDEGIVNFLIPRFRDDLKETILKAQSLMYRKERVRILFIEDICEKIMKVENTNIKNHYSEFIRKYLSGLST